MYRLKIAGTDQVSFGPVPVLMVVKIIRSTVNPCSAELCIFLLLSFFENIVDLEQLIRIHILMAQMIFSQILGLWPPASERY